MTIPIGSWYDHGTIRDSHDGTNDGTIDGTIDLHGSSWYDQLLCSAKKDETGLFMSFPPWSRKFFAWNKYTVTMERSATTSGSDENNQKYVEILSR
jgi:hypothetical protein